MDLGILQETKCIEGIYTHDLDGYHIVATDAPRRHRGGVALFYRPSSLFAVEDVRQFGPNVLSFHLAMGERRWYIIGCYLAPEDTSTIERVVAALKERSKGTKLVVVGDLNTVLDEPENNWRGTVIVAEMIEAGVEDMTAHFLPRRHRWEQEKRTWSMVREGKAVRSRTDYILGIDQSLFRNVSVRDPQHNTFS